MGLKLGSIWIDLKAGPHLEEQWRNNDTKQLIALNCGSIHEWCTDRQFLSHAVMFFPTHPVRRLHVHHVPVMKYYLALLHTTPVQINDVYLVFSMR